MLINLTKSSLFTIDPDRRFSDMYGVPLGMWKLIYNRAKYLNYSIPEMCELYQIKTKKEIPRLTMTRWVWRTDVYNKVHPFVKMGTRTVMSEIFGEYEDEVIKELTKHIKSGEAKDSRSII
jgi:hypothetical protein